MTKEQVMARLGTVMDPELPGVSIVDLGMVDDIRLDEHGIHVGLLPTFLGCPALDLIRHHVELALKDAGPLDVQWVHHQTWSSARITQDGRQALLAWGVSEPTQGSQDPVTCPFCGSTQTRSISRFGRTLCQQLYYCENCSQPFDRFKTV